jgi:hypothetical protein
MDLPPAARLWRDHAIGADAGPVGAVRLRMHGRIKVSAWQPFRATQVIDPGHGYAWTAGVGRSRILFRGADRLWDGEGSMRWRLLGVVPVIRASGPDVARSAAGRLAAEYVFHPPALLAAARAWEDEGPDRFTVTLEAGGDEHRVTIDLAPDGAVRRVGLLRWGSPDRGPFALHPFGALLEDEATDAGYTVPATMRAGWWPDDERWEAGEFFRATLDQVRYAPTATGET